MLSIDIESVFVLGNKSPGHFHKLCITGQHSVADETLDTLLRIREIATPGTERLLEEFLLSVLKEFLILRIGQRPLSEDAYNIAGLAVLDLSFSICSKRLDRNDGSRLELILITVVIIGDVLLHAEGVGPGQ